LLKSSPVLYYRFFNQFGSVLRHNSWQHHPHISTRSLITSLESSALGIEEKRYKMSSQPSSSKKPTTPRLGSTPTFASSPRRGSSPGQAPASPSGLPSHARPGDLSSGDPPAIPDAQTDADLLMTMTASVVLTSLPGDARQALERTALKTEGGVDGKGRSTELV
jgi:hypothetical protein